MITMATAAKRGKAAGKAPKGAFKRAGKGVKSMYAQFNFLAKGGKGKGSRSSKALGGGGGG